MEVEENEKDDLDHLVARLLQVKYLIRVGSVTSADSGKTTNGLEAAFPLVRFSFAFFHGAFETDTSNLIDR